ncbi:MAG: DUF924 domain-containing protein [Candidatus Dadabacteria bacterium]|nr:MAG: DUF924 domain-containing protein [Candidatus Dadabacteria bacterium]
MRHIAPAQILDWWFGTTGPDGVSPSEIRKRWFQGGAQVDKEIAERFGGAVEAARSGALADWVERDPDALALILLTDQFTRNVYRGTPEMFAADPIALDVAHRLIESGRHERYPNQQRVFIYMPLMHSENLDDQNECIQLFEQLVAEADTDAQRDAFASNVDYAIRHRDIVARFGRFPHRNATLGRETTPEEAEFLTQPGSRF